MPNSDQVLPIVDITSSSAAQQVYDAATTLGFFFINGTDFTADEVDNIFALSKSFFALPYEEKQKFAIQSHNRGYSRMNKEKLDLSTNGDPKEAFNFGQFDNDGKPIQSLPSIFAHNELTIAKHAQKCHATCNKVLDLLAEALQIDPDRGGNQWFSSRHNLNQYSGSILRFLYYPAQDDADLNHVRAGAHTDYGSVTLLFQRPGQEGLEVRSPVTGEWLPIPALQARHDKSCPPIVVNIADQLSFWSAGVLKSALHRVKSAETVQARRRDRYSVAYFCHPADDTLLEPVPSLVISSVQDRGPADPGNQYKVLTAGEHLAKRLAAAYDWEK
ncbi:hypothetical protein V1514DRAFT_326450 [Lipomyces japonicus]|uniref:uncharacterized protein n=1 Tax=Lipomyces japonicus TaxID=56871 RepID=UPI0034CD8B50